MDRFYRAQHRGFDFGALMSHTSEDGGDGCTDGVCATETVTDLLNNTVLDAMDPDDDVIVFEGYKICDIYDGCRVSPVREIARVSVTTFIADPYALETM